MTDNEIIKALKLCTSEHMGCEDGCPYRLGECLDDGYRSKPMKDALDLINRQKAEIERLREQIKKGDKIYEDHMLKMEAEKDNLKQVIERLQKLQKPTKTSGFIIQNGKVVFYTNILNGYRHEYKDLEEVVKELNLMLQSCYKCDEVVSHYKGNLKIAKSEAYREFAEKAKSKFGMDCLYSIRVINEEIDNTLKELTRNLHGTCTETTDQTATNQSVSLIDGQIEE